MSEESVVLALEDLHEGMTESFPFNVTQAMMAAFTELSADRNPLHTDDDFAESRGFGGRVVYGGILIAKLSCMIGMRLPGRDALWNSFNFHFVRPLMVGQEASVHATVVHVSAATSSIRLNIRIASAGDTIAMGSADVTLLQVGENGR